MVEVSRDFPIIITRSRREPPTIYLYCTNTETHLRAREIHCTFWIMTIQPAVRSMVFFYAVSHLSLHAIVRWERTNPPHHLLKSKPIFEVYFLFFINRKHFPTQNGCVDSLSVCPTPRVYTHAYERPCTHVKDPVVRVRVRWIMETRK